MQVYGCRFAVDTRPVCMWAIDLPAENLRAIQQLDPMYFRYLADSHHGGLGGAEKHRAALALRSAYSHALETFFAVLCAAIQAPECVGGWLLRYRLEDLRAMVGKIRGGRPIYSRLLMESSFESAAEAIHSFVKPPRATIVPLFGELWLRFAGEFLDDLAALEYNSLKHGFRVGAGGCALSAGIETTPGVAAPPEAMQLVGGSEYGSSFSTAAATNVKAHWRLERTTRNWNPLDCFAGLYLLSISLANVQAFLRIVNGDRETQTFRWPEDDGAFEAPWLHSPDLVHAGINYRVSDEAIRPFSPAEILSVYDR